MAAMKLNPTNAVVFMMVTLMVLMLAISSYAADGDSCTDHCAISCAFCNGKPLYDICCINNCCPSFRASILSNYLRI